MPPKATVSVGQCMCTHGIAANLCATLVRKRRKAPASGEVIVPFVIIVEMKTINRRKYIAYKYVYLRKKKKRECHRKYHKAELPSNHKTLLLEALALASTLLSS